MISKEDCGNQTLEAVATGSIARDAEIVPCDVQLRYFSKSPYVVSVIVSAPETGGGKWLLSRDLLSAGLTGTAGVGSVSVEPEALDGQELQVRIQISDSEGEWLLRIDHRALLVYLEYTHTLVPFGSEALLGGIDDKLDEALDRILGED